jgi:hypothetical protein
VKHLVPCGGCDRHVKSDEPTCPFCGAAVDARRPVPGRPSARLGRAATFAFGAALAAASASGCGESHTPDDAAAEEPDAGTDAGEATPPPDDAGPAPLYGGAPPPEEDAGFAPLYGGAPED